MSPFNPFQIGRRAGRHDVSRKRRHIGMADGGRELREDRVEWLSGNDGGPFNCEAPNSDAIGSRSEGGRLGVGGQERRHVSCERLRILE